MEISIKIEWEVSHKMKSRNILAPFELITNERNRLNQEMKKGSCLQSGDPKAYELAKEFVRICSESLGESWNPKMPDYSVFSLDVILREVITGIWKLTDTSMQLTTGIDSEIAEILLPLITSLGGENVKAYIDNDEDLEYGECYQLNRNGELKSNIYEIEWGDEDDEE